MRGEDKWEGEEERDDRMNVRVRRGGVGREGC
jgi:hypothetical protein